MVSSIRTGVGVIGWFSGAGPRFTNGFFIAIQIRWKFRFTLISILIQWSLQNFVHGTTAVLSWHVQKFVAIWWPTTELQQGEVSIEFKLRAKNRYWNGPLDLLNMFQTMRKYFPQPHTRLTKFKYMISNENFITRNVVLLLMHWT